MDRGHLSQPIPGSLPWVKKCIETDAGSPVEVQIKKQT